MVFTSRSLLYYFKNKIKLTPINQTIIDSNILNDHTSKKFFSLNPKVVGETVNSKIKRLIQILRKDGSDHIFISAPENVVWLLNIRGRDNPFSPIPNCRIVLNTRGEVSFFSNITKVSNILKKKDFLKTSFFKEDQIKNFLSKLSVKKIIIDKNSCPVLLENLISSKFKISKIGDPLYLMKSIKNKVEIL